MTIKKTKVINSQIINKIDKTFKQSMNNPQFKKDYEAIKSTRLDSIKPNPSKPKSEDPQVKPSQKSPELAGAAINDNDNDYKLNTLYRRFVSPRKHFGWLIDKIKNKFYYETHHFIGAIVDKQEQINKQNLQLISQLTTQLKDQERNHKQQLSLLKSSISDLSQKIAQNHEQNIANEEKTARIFASLLKYVEALRHKLTAIKSEIDSNQNDLSKAQTDISDLNEETSKLEKSIKQLSSNLANSIKQLKYPSLDFNYVDFEKTFYGDHESLQNKHRQYMKYVKDAKNVLDIGCGSGAFLALLKSVGIKAQGIDSNRQVVKDARRHNLDVVHAEAIRYLRKQADSTFDVISCFHVIEHLHPQDWLNFFALCFKKLQPNGKLLLETPNNTMLGIFMKGFYMDPTHVRPVHPETMEFALKDIGFTNVEIFTSSPLPEGDRLMPVNNPQMDKNIQKLNKALFGDQDLSIIATKPQSV